MVKLKIMIVAVNLNDKHNYVIIQIFLVNKNLFQSTALHRPLI